MSQLAQSRAKPSGLADLVALIKPNIVVFALLTVAGGMSLAPGTPSAGQWLAVLLGTGLIVGAANTLNMYLERDIDCLMSRTKDRPLPAGRMDPELALAFGVAQAFVSVPLLTFALNPLTGLLGVTALLSYVMVYTPLKQRTTVATLIGAVPGAMPPLMGWTAATGTIDAGGLAVFALLFLWQIPHFHAIALFRHKEYDRAGLKTLPGVRGNTATHRAIVVYTVAQVVASFAIFAVGVSGVWYLVTASVCGLGFLLYSVRGLRPDAGPRWARNLFLASIVYLPIVFIALFLNGQA